MGGLRVLPAGVVKGLFDGLEPISALQPRLDLSSLAGRGQLHHGSSSHAVTKNTTVGSASKLQRTANIAIIKTAGYQLFYQHGNLGNTKKEISRV